MVSSRIDPPSPLSGYEVLRDDKKRYKLNVWTKYSTSINKATYFLSKKNARQLIKDLQEIVVNDT